MKRDRRAVTLRHAEMLAMIRDRQEVLVEELARAFDISLMTVRRDLQVLEEQGKISRFHGGASVDVRPVSSDEKDRVALCQRLIARRAAALVNDLEAPAMALHPEIGAAQAALREAGALGVRMSGSGSTVFGLVRTEEEGRRVAAQLEAKGLKAWSVRTACPVV